MLSLKNLTIFFIKHGVYGILLHRATLSRGINIKSIKYKLDKFKYKIYILIKKINRYIKYKYIHGKAN